MPRAIDEAPAPQLRDPARGKHHHHLTLPEGVPRLAPHLAGFGEGALLQHPFDRHQHLGEARRDPQGIPVGEIAKVTPDAFQGLIEGKAVGDPGRVVGDEDARSGARHMLEPAHLQAEGQKLRHIVERLPGRQRADPVGHRDRLPVFEEGQPGWRAACGPLLDEGVDNMGRPPGGEVRAQSGC